MFGQQEDRDKGRGESYLLRWPLQFSQKTRQSPWQTPEQLHWGPHKWRDQCRSSSLGSLIGWDKQVNIPDRIRFTAITNVPSTKGIPGRSPSFNQVAVNFLCAISSSWVSLSLFSLDHSGSLPSTSPPYFFSFYALDEIWNRLLTSDRSGPVPTPGTHRRQRSWLMPTKCISRKAVVKW